MAGPGFVHLHVHSAYSLLEGALPLAKLLALAAKDMQPALAVSDTSNLFGALEFSEKAAQKGIQPIISCEVRLNFDDEEESVKSKTNFVKNSVVLIARSEAGFINLSALVSQAFLQSEDGVADVPIDWLNEKSTKGLTCLTGGPEGAIDPLYSQGQKCPGQFNA